MVTSSPLARLRMIRSAPGSLRFSRLAAFWRPPPCSPPAAGAAPRTAGAPPPRPPAPPRPSPRPAAAGAPAPPGPAATLVIRQPRRGLFREAEAADLLECLHLAVGQRH